MAHGQARLRQTVCTGLGHVGEVVQGLSVGGAPCGRSLVLYAFRCCVLGASREAKVET